MSLMSLDRKNDYCVLLVDVGPHMHACLPHLDEFVSRYVEAKYLAKPAHEVAIVLFGTTGTLNEVNQEFEVQGHPGQYAHITVLENLRLPDQSMLRSAARLERGRGASDVFNGLLVVADLFKKASEHRNIPDKHCVLISNLAFQGEPIDDVTLDHIVTSFEGVRLDVVCPDMEHEQQNTQQLHVQRSVRMAQEAPLLSMLSRMRLPGLQYAHSASELLSMIRWRETKGTATFDGNLTMGTKLQLPVKMYKKVGSEKPPSLKDYAIDQGVPTQVERQRSFVVKKDEKRKEGEEGGPAEDMGPDSDAEEVDPGDLVKGYKYGRLYIPVDMAQEERLKFFYPDRSLQVLGFAEKSQIPRYALTKEPSVVMARNEDPKACVAVSAFVQAMAQADKVAVVRMVQKENKKPELLVFMPKLASPEEGLADCWVANGLPFAHEVRWCTFPSLCKPEQEPSPEQQEAANNLVSSLDLTNAPIGPESAPKEMMRPEEVVNPVLHRFYASVAKKVVDGSGAELPPVESDALRQVLQPSQQLFSQCNPALSSLQELLRTEVLPYTQGTKRKREADGVKHNVGLCVVNREGLVFAAKHADVDECVWQMPQGGIEEGENPEAAAKRELVEETSIRSVRVLHAQEKESEYDDHLRRHVHQKWFLLHFYGDDTEINLKGSHPEFETYTWMPLQQVAAQVRENKKAMYKEVEDQFLPKIEELRTLKELEWKP